MLRWVPLKHESFEKVREWKKCKAENVGWRRKKERFREKNRSPFSPVFVFNTFPRLVRRVSVVLGFSMYFSSSFLFNWIWRLFPFLFKLAALTFRYIRENAQKSFPEDQRPFFFEERKEGESIYKGEKRSWLWIYIHGTQQQHTHTMYNRSLVCSGLIWPPLFRARSIMLFERKIQESKKEIQRDERMKKGESSSLFPYHGYRLYSLVPRTSSRVGESWKFLVKTYKVEFLRFTSLQSAIHFGKKPGNLGKPRQFYFPLNALWALQLPVGDLSDQRVECRLVALCCVCACFVVCTFYPLISLIPLEASGAQYILKPVSAHLRTKRQNDLFYSQPTRTGDKVYFLP